MKYLARELGLDAWNICYGEDIYEAAECFAETLDDEGRLTEGESVKIQIKKDETDQIRLVLVYAEIEVKYQSRGI